MKITLTSNEIGQQFMREGVDGITYTLVWFDEVPRYSAGKHVLWAKVVRTGEQNGHSYLVRQDSLRRVPCVMCEHVEAERRAKQAARKARKQQTR